MYNLPLFPLNTVLFPDMPLPLHIFEERYKLMINRCRQEERPFGVVLIQSGEAQHGPLAIPHSVGCTAKIANVQELSEGRLFIMAIGQERFRIVSVNKDNPYLIGTVEKAPLQGETNARLPIATPQLHSLVVEYLQILSKIGKVEFDPTQIPTDPHSFLYLAASIIQLPLERKQSFLAADQAINLLYGLYNEYRDQVTLLRAMPPNDQGSFSIN